MKKMFTKSYYLLSVIGLVLAMATPVRAQFAGTTLESGGLYTALAKDASGNLYETRVKSGTAGVTYAVYKYTNGTGTPALIYQNLTHEVDDFPWGLAVTSTGNIFISTDFSSGSGKILKLTYNSGSNTYAGSVYQSGRFFTALAVDASDNIYATEYDATNLTYAVVRYPANSTNNFAGVKLYDNLKSGAGYNYPTGLAVNSTGDVYVADAFSNVPTITDGGHVYKLTKASSYAVSTVSTGLYSSALAVDASNNLYSSENNGSGYGVVKYPGGGGTGITVFPGLHTNGIHYPWGLASVSTTKIFVADGDDGINGGSVIQCVPIAPTVTTNAATLVKATSATLNGTVNDNGLTTTVSFNYGTSSTLAGATTIAATTGGTIPAGTGNTAASVSIAGLTASKTYYYQVTATNGTGTSKGAILSFLTPPAISYPGPDTYVTGTPVTLTPTSTTVPTGAYGAPYAIGTGYAFTVPFGVATDAAGNVYVAADGNQALLKIPAGGGTVVTLATGFSTLTGVAIDAAGNIYTADTGSGLVQEFVGGTGTPVTLGTGFTQPYGVAVDAASNVYVADYGLTSIVKIPAGNGTPVSVGSGFVNPVGVALNAAGDIFVADYGDSKVYKIPGGTGTPVSYGSGFSGPVGITTNAAGNVFVTNYTANTVVKIPVGGGTPVAIGSGYFEPSGVATDGAGNLYIADFANSAVKEITPTGGYYLNNALPRGLSINGNTGVISGTPTVATPAANYIITAYNATGGTAATVNIAVVSNNANLTNLVPSYNSLNADFNSSVFNYSETVPYDISSLKVTPTASNSNATIKVNGVTVLSGKASAAIPLSVGQNTISTVVTAQDGVTTNTYTITVTRSPKSTVSSLYSLALSNGTLSPGFSSATLTYSTNVGNGLTTMTVTPTLLDTTARVTVNGQPVTSGTPSQHLPLVVGANTVNIVVTAQDGVTKTTYTLTINEARSGNSNLAGLVLSSGAISPAFAATTTAYTQTVNYAISSLTVTPTTADATATVTVNGPTVTSGSPSGAIALSVGSNTITVIVTAQNTTTKTYTVTVTRTAPSNNPNLTALATSSGTLSPAFTTGNTSYTTNVGASINNFTVTPTASNQYEVIKVNGTVVTTGTASQVIPLTAGPNTVTILVTAQDGTTTKTYTLTVNEAQSTNDNLLSIKTSGGLAQGQVVPTTMTESVSNALGSITVTPTVIDATATVKVNGVSVGSGTASGNIALAVGPNTITIIVTAQSGATKTYTLTVTRAAGGVNIPDVAVSVDKPTETPQLAEDGIAVHQGISPNGDGVNDFLQIDNITNYPDNKLKIMDRNGLLVYEMTGYDNSSKTFDGHSNKNGRMQLPGTYFYELDYAVNGITKHKTGFIILKY